MAKKSNKALREARNPYGGSYSRGRGKVLRTIAKAAARQHPLDRERMKAKP